MESSSSSSTSSIYNNISSSEETLRMMMMNNKPPPRKPFHSSLHSTRNSNHNKGKLHIAPLPPNPPRVYKVDPINFRDLVQRLTGATAAAAEQGRMQSLAPPKLDLLPPPLQQLLPPSSNARSGGGEGKEDGLVERQEGSPFSALFRELMMTPESTSAGNQGSDMMMMRSSYVDVNNDYFYNTASESVITSTSLELNLLSSPTTTTSHQQHCWFPSQLLSPAGATTLDQHSQRTINL